MIVLLRHGHAGSRNARDDDDRARPLSGRGRDQAQLLAARLGEHDIERIISSPYLRCLQTMEPFSRAAGVVIEQSAALIEGADPDGARELMTSDATVICSHGDVLEGLVLRLAEEGVPVDPEVPFAKGGAWWLRTNGGSVIAAAYTPPPA